MKPLMAFIIYILAVIVLYGTGKQTLFWLAVGNLALYIGLAIAVALITAKAAYSRQATNIAKMEAGGMSAEEITNRLKFSKEDKKSVPTSIRIIAWSSLAAAAALLSAGILIRFW